MAVYKWTLCQHPSAQQATQSYSLMGNTNEHVKHLIYKCGCLGLSILHCWNQARKNNFETGTEMNTTVLSISASSLANIISPTLGALPCFSIHPCTNASTISIAPNRVQSLSFCIRKKEEHCGVHVRLCVYAIFVLLVLASDMQYRHFQT